MNRRDCRAFAGLNHDAVVVNPVPPLKAGGDAALHGPRQIALGAGNVRGRRGLCQARQFGLNRAELLLGLFAALAEIGQAVGFALVTIIQRGHDAAPLLGTAGQQRALRFQFVRQGIQPGLALGQRLLGIHKRGIQTGDIGQALLARLC